MWCLYFVNDADDERVVIEVRIGWGVWVDETGDFLISGKITPTTDVDLLARTTDAEGYRSLATSATVRARVAVGAFAAVEDFA